ncbi:MAG: ABC transporter permease [Candidatus Kapabacteria bacterium]|jgi:spermidine/putrescine transport system permease protein|nr:ABC transporter permease [Candidatus Kapabacteria bacterium]
MRRIFTTGSAALVLAFIYIPLCAIIWYSFSAESVNSFPIKAYSLEWYKVMASDESLLRAVGNSLRVAFASTAFALLIGVPATFALHKFDFTGKRMVERIVLMPITLPGIVTGVAMLSFFPRIGVELSLLAVGIGHVTFLLAIVVTQLLSRFKRLDPNLEQAAYDLGATPLTAFFTVIIPNIRTAIIGAALLCLVLSMDEIPVTFFLIARDNTLPIEIYGMMRRGITPEVNAISTLIFLATVVILVISLRLMRTSNDKVIK